MNNSVSKESGTPLYLQIQDLILDEIRAGNLSPGSPVYSEHDLAARLDVSRLTVRRAYSEMAKRRILYSIHGKGTFVSEHVHSNGGTARVESTERGTTLAVVFPEVSHFFGPVLHAIEEEAKKYGMHINLMFNSTVRAENEAVTRVLSNTEIGGLIITPFRQTKSRTYQQYAQIAKSGVPTVMVGKPPFHLHFDSVYCDDVVAAYDLVAELIVRGHHRITWLMDSVGDSEAVYERREGYLRAMAELGGDTSQKVLDLQSHGFEKDILSEVQAGTSAICCDTDRSAAQIMNLLISNGYRVPDDVSLVGYDNYDLCDTLPVPLSSIDQPKQQMGERAFELLYKKIMNPSPAGHGYAEAHHTVYVPSLVDRKSIARLT